MVTEFDPGAMTRAAGLAALQAALPQLGRHYAAERNTAPRPGEKPTTSRLSPWLRRRLVTEQEAAGAALAAHGPAAAEKFVLEVLWRTYFKGYLEQHPGAWTRYRAALARGGWDARILANAEHARAGSTGIACFDAWATALRETGWLHNHERMWFASIWIFTLRLPWELGAAFFEDELIDFDPASNTLSWRWVAGLHTRGKHYVARADNIARYTQGRFDPAGALDEAPDPIEEAEPPPRVRPPAPEPVPDGPCALLLHEEDLSPETMRLPEGVSRAAILCLDQPRPQRRHEAARTACADARHRLAVLAEQDVTLLSGRAELASWAASLQPGVPVVTPYAAVGPVADALAGVAQRRLLRAWDAELWPSCAKGFYKLRSQFDSARLADTLFP